MAATASGGGDDGRRPPDKNDRGKDKDKDEHDERTKYKLGRSIWKRIARKEKGKGKAGEDAVELEVLRRRSRGRLQKSTPGESYLDDGLVDATSRTVASHSEVGSGQ